MLNLSSVIVEVGYRNSEQSRRFEFSTIRVVRIREENNELCQGVRV